ncbi:hypothetical protein QL285_028213 [Trifolium repens]|nr:hypothetical protein QL285_028213 [Trifolium repens]
MTIHFHPSRVLSTFPFNKKLQWRLCVISTVNTLGHFSRRDSLAITVTLSPIESAYPFNLNNDARVCLSFQFKQTMSECAYLFNLNNDVRVCLSFQSKQTTLECAYPFNLSSDARVCLSFNLSKRCLSLLVLSIQAMTPESAYLFNLSKMSPESALTSTSNFLFIMGKIRAFLYLIIFHHYNVVKDT